MIIRHLSASGLVALAIGFLLIAHGCRKDKTIVPSDPLEALNLPATPFNYASPGLPAFFTAANITAQDNTPAGNATSNWGATLGRVLFYDKILSINTSTSCAGCHRPETGFSDPETFSRGFAGGRTPRHSMSLINARYYPNGRFFWDERAATLEAQVLQPILDPLEMGMRMDTLLNRINRTTYYPVLLERAFGDRTANPDRISRALAQFIRSLVSYRSKFDTGRALILPPANPVTTPYPNFTAAENRGKALFFGPQTGCATCHGTETFSAPRAEINGLESVLTDRGVGAITNNPADNGRFKVPSLKNIERTAPYMHDGRLTTLEQVIEHYNSGVQFHPNLPPVLRNPPPDVNQPRRLNLTAQDKADLLAFLKTLTDDRMLQDEKFSNPFR
ncbi:MAG TPA: cytochrome c peroxidase [Lacibacter sp.]|nr:cytochrome c peroxidase [Lacibacter sp.]HMO89095.1 cytochrome c peroxidase [Lacibacter sp.]